MATEKEISAIGFHPVATATEKEISAIGFHPVATATATFLKFFKSLRFDNGEVPHAKEPESQAHILQELQSPERM